MTSDPARRQPIRAQVVSKPKISTSAKVKMEGSGAERPVGAGRSGPGRGGPGCGAWGPFGRAARPDRPRQPPAAALELWSPLCRPCSPAGQDGDCTLRTCCTRATAACAQCVGRRAGLRTVARGGRARGAGPVSWGCVSICCGGAA